MGSVRAREGVRGPDPEGQLWVAAWRVTLDRFRLAYCLTLHRTEPRQPERSERRYGPPVRKGG